MAFVLPRSLWFLVLLTFAGCAIWGLLAPNGLLAFVGLLSAFGSFAVCVQQVIEGPAEAKIRRR